MLSTIYVDNKYADRNVEPVRYSFLPIFLDFFFLISISFSDQIFLRFSTWFDTSVESGTD